LKDVDMLWANRMREEIEQSYQHCLVQIAGLQIQSGRFEEGLRVARQAIDHDPLDERAYQEVMQAYGGLQDRSMIIRTYQKIKEILEKELGVPPSSETKKIYELLTF